MIDTAVRIPDWQDAVDMPDRLSQQYFGKRVVPNRWLLIAEGHHGSLEALFQLEYEALSKFKLVFAW